jgi:hypothetical protein
MVTLGVVLVTGGLFGGVALYASWNAYHSPERQVLRRIRSLPARRIADLADGEDVRIRGQIRAATTRPAPMSGRPCVYSRVTVREHRRIGDTHLWFILFQEEARADFSVVDDSGEVLVRMVRPQVSVVRDSVTECGGSVKVTPPQAAMLLRHGEASQLYLGCERTLRFEEGVLEPGERVSVVGRVHVVEGELRLLEPLTDGGLYVTDDPSAW